MIQNSQAWKKRAEEILATEHVAGADSEAIQFAVSMLTAFYGSASPQLEQFQNDCRSLAGSEHYSSGVNVAQLRYAKGAIKNAVRELEAGLVVRVRVAVAGEVLGELARVGKEILDEKTDEGKNVGAVLIAAAYEGTLRKMGEELAGVTERPDLQGVIAALKRAGILVGASVSVAQGYLKFRNDALHADWKNVERPEVSSCLAFVESLLQKHFG